MTKEELEKEADEYAIENEISVVGEEYWSYDDIKQAYLAGAEPREKRIAELEKELEQSKKVQIVEHFEAYGQCRDSRRIAGLEAENAELKSDIKTMIPLLEKAKDMFESLSKAEKLIKELCSMVRELNKPNVQLTDIDYSLADAEQFLKEFE